MAVTYKDIGQLTQKSSLAGTEKLPVSDVEYITPSQISSLSGISIDDAYSDFAVCDENGMAIVAFRKGHIQTKNFDSATISTLLSDIETLLAAL